MTRRTRNSRTTRGSGVTLVELLVVVSIMMLLALVTLPTLRPAMEGRRIREATRAVNVFLSAAQNRATAAQQAFGVELERDPNLLLGCRTLYQVEVPSPYPGELATSVINVVATGSPTNAIVQFWSSMAGATPFENPVRLGLVRAGDELRLDYMGPYWTITSIAPAGPPDTFNFGFSYSTVAANGGLPLTAGVRYQIYRQPIRSNVPPLQLPRGVVVDFTYSGGQNLFLPYDNADQRSVVLLFNTRHSIDRIYATNVNTNDYTWWRATGPVFLLVGHRDRVPIDIQRIGPAPGTLVIGPSPAEDLGTNLVDLGNLWVTVNPQTGFIASAEMAATDPAAPNIVEARAFASQFQLKGGR